MSFKKCLDCGKDAKGSLASSASEEIAQEPPFHRVRPQNDSKLRLKK